MRSSPDGDLPGGELSLVGNYPGEDLSWWGVVLVGSHPVGVVRMEAVQWGVMFVLALVFGPPGIIFVNQGGRPCHRMDGAKHRG